MNTRRQSWKERTGMGRGEERLPGAAGPLSAPRTAPGLPPRAGPRTRTSLLGHSPVVDLQDGEPCVLRQLFLLLLRGVWVLWPPARVTLPAQQPSGPQGLAP